jgi:nucleoside-triphosphatase
MPCLILTGSPGVGKTTAIMRLAEMLKERGIKVGGIISNEVRQDGVRIGFEFVDISSKKTAMLASVSGTGPDVGKYKVSIEGCRFAVQVLKEALQKTDVIICDELGPMEFKSKEFVECAEHMLDQDKPIVAVVHKKLRHPLLDRLRESGAFTIELDIQNRNKVPDLLLNRLEL